MPKTNLVKRGKTYVFRKMVEGRLIRISLGTDYQQALNRLRSLTDKPAPEKLSVEEAAKRWLDVVPLTRKDPSLPIQRVRDYLVPFMGHFLLQKVSGESCRSYRLWLEQQGKSRQTVKHILSDLRAFLNWCEQAGLIERSLFPKRIMPKIAEQPPDRLTDEEVLAVCEAPDPYGFVCRFLVSTGLRWGEAIRATSAQVQGGLLVVSGTKSGKVRRVPLPEEFRLRVGRFVPFKSHGAFNKQVVKLSRDLGFHVHRLRHTAACLWLEKGGSLAALQELLGHSTIVTTQRYAGLGESHVQEEARRIGPLVTKLVTAEKEQKA